MEEAGGQAEQAGEPLRSAGSATADLTEVNTFLLSLPCRLLRLHSLFGRCLVTGAWLVADKPSEQGWLD
jgi:hypothetical protein